MTWLEDQRQAGYLKSIARHLERMHTVYRVVLEAMHGLTELRRTTRSDHLDDHNQ
jgi:hypothetical protein